MPHETATLFLALLALALAVGLIVLGLALLTGDRGRPLVAMVHGVALELAALVALVCMFGSLYLSESVGFEPCRLCWVQRAFMYPAAVLLLVAVVIKRKPVALAAGALAVVGLPVSLFHRWEQAAGEIAGFCDAATPCSARWINHFGFVTIPTMAAVGFLGVLSFVALHVFWRNS